MSPAERLKRIRNFLGYSQRELAAEFQVTNGAIAHWESGARPVPGPVLKLIEIYEKSLDIETETDSLVTVEALEASRNLFKLSLESLKKEGLKVQEETSQRLGAILESFFVESFSKNKITGKLKVVLFRRILKSFEGSRGISVKAAQLTSFLELGLPTEIIALLGDLQNSGTPMSPSAVKDILKSAYDGKLNSYFSNVHWEPLAVTSLAQIHRATLKTGEKVILKIRHSGIEEILRGQFKKLSFFSVIGNLLGVSSAEIFSEIQQQVILEMDYRREAFNQERFRNIFENEPRIVIPKIYRDLCRQNIIVSHYEPGLSFSAFRARATPRERSQAALLISYFHGFSAFKRNLIHGDAHPDNFLFQNDKVIFLDFGRIIELAPEEIEIQRELFLGILFKNKTKVIKILKETDAVQEPESFDFDGFWRLLLRQQAHQLAESFKITKDHLKLLHIEEQKFRDRKKLKLSKDRLHSAIVNMSLMFLFGELEAEVSWREQALKILDGKSCHN